MYDYMRVVQSLNIVHQDGGGGIEPLDLAPETRHLDVTRASLEILDKTFTAWTIGRAMTEDVADLMCIAFGVDRDGLAQRPVILGGINTNSPLQLDIPMAEALIALAELGQPVVVTPFTLAGAMAPITLAGALVEQNAEALAGIALTQIVNPGTPVVYGAFTSNVDMKTGAPAFGTPEYAKAQFASGQLARRHGLPFRSSNTTASNVVDAQAAYEGGMSLWSTVMAHTHLIHHAAGWLEGGLTASFEKLIIDAEMLQMMAELLNSIEVDDDTLGFDAMAEVGPGGHFFGAAHTLERYETAFYQPMVSDWRNFETWEESGGLTATQRANGIWKQLLAGYEAPANDPAVLEALDAFVAQRKEEIMREAST
jgi:trimethylamine--corrinoid protein Co-methyltransferase